MSAPADIHVRAPATTANIGPGFDCAGAALDLWNELELRPGDGPADREHLGVRAFERLAPADGWSFEFTDKIPQARGLGSSASVSPSGSSRRRSSPSQEPTADELLALGLELEGHGDNLAAALVGRRLPDLGNADRPDRRHDAGDADRRRPGGARPDGRIASCAARRRCLTPTPRSPPAGRRCSAPRSRAARPISSKRPSRTGCTSPTAPTSAPLLGQVRAQLPAAAVGATLSGAGPTVIVWARARAKRQACAERASIALSRTSRSFR